MKIKTPLETHNELAHLDRSYFIDIRDPEDFEISHPLGAQGGMKKIELLSMLSQEQDKSIPIYVICYRGNSSLLFQGLLEENGFQNSYSVEGGFAQWKTESLPIQGKEGVSKKLNEMQLYSLTEGQKSKEISHAGQLEMMGLMSASAFHEIVNPLSIIDYGLKSSVKEIYRAREINEQKAIKETFDKLDDKLLKLSGAVSRIESILKVMRGLSYNIELEKKETIVLEEFINEVVTISKMISSVKVNLKIDSSLLSENFNIHKNQLFQIFTNLIKNADDELRDQDEKWIEIHAIKDNNMLYFNVIDSGKGIPLEIQEKLVLPLFTTKDKGKGTGLGLSIVKELCLANKGELFIDRNSKNTSFVFSIDISE